MKDLKLDDHIWAHKDVWERVGIHLPTYDRAKLIRETTAKPQWVHFGAGNIFRAFIAELQQKLLEEHLTATGIIAVAPNDKEMVQKIYRPHDNLTLLVRMPPDAPMEQEVIGSITEGLAAVPDNADWQRLLCISTAPSLQIMSFTITEKGYRTRDAARNVLPQVAVDMERGIEHPRSFAGKITCLLYHRYQTECKPIALLSLDNCAQNGQILRDMVLEIAIAWQKHGYVPEGFLHYVQEEITYPCSMIDKITPRPAEAVRDMLVAEGVENMAFVRSSRGGVYAPFVNAEKAGYLVVEDTFPNGRPPLEKVGVLFTDADTVAKTERMKVSACLNPLHTALAIFGCLLGFSSIAEEMRDDDLSRLVRYIGQQETMQAVENPKIIDPQKFLEECLQQRFPNPHIPDTPQRIACDTSQKIPVRFGVTLKVYQTRTDLHLESLQGIPLVIAAWCRYLTGIDDTGRPFICSTDPLLEELSAPLRGFALGEKIPDNVLASILHRTDIFGIDLSTSILGTRIEQAFQAMMCECGAIRKVLHRTVLGFGEDVA